MFINNGKGSCRRPQSVITGRAARLPPLTAGEQEGLRVKGTIPSHLPSESSSAPFFTFPPPVVHCAAIVLLH